MLASTAILFALRHCHVQLMAHQRRSRAERILALEASKTADLSLGYASSGLALRRPKGKDLVVERLAGWALGRLCAILANSRFLRTISGTGNELRTPTPRA